MALLYRQNLMIEKKGDRLDQAYRLCILAEQVYASCALLSAQYNTDKIVRLPAHHRAKSILNISIYRNFSCIFIGGLLYCTLCSFALCV